MPRTSYTYRRYRIEPQGEHGWQVTHGASFMVGGYPSKEDAEALVDLTIRCQRRLERIARGEDL